MRCPRYLREGIHRLIFRHISFGVLLVAMVATVVCGFYIPYKRSRSRMTRLWLVAWLIVVAHSILPLLGTNLHVPALLVGMLSDILIVLGAIVFLWSFASSPSDYKRLHVPWAELLMVEASGYCVISNLWHQPSILHSVILLISAAVVTLTFIRWLSTSATLPRAIYLPLVGLTASFATYQIVRGHYSVPVFLFQSACNLCTSLFLIRRYRIMAGGAIITSACFALWAGMPYAHLVTSGPPFLLAFTQGYLSAIGLISLVAAQGMLILLLEEEVQININGRERERRVRQELEAYAQLDLHIMPGSEPHQAAELVCRLAVEHSVFRQAVIFLRDVKQTFYVAAAEGMSAELLRAVEALGQRMTDARMRDFQRDLSRQRVSPNSSRVNLRALFLPGDPLEQLNFISAISINLRSQTGVVIGSLLLSEPRLHGRHDDLRADDLLPLETLVAKLSIAIENTMLTQRLLRSEKLAGLGQLAGGVAHELNNPLTVVMGYSDLMADATDVAEMHSQAGIIHKEALRMKEIVESLVRFWRPAPNNSQQINLTQTLRDIYRLRAAELERRGIHFEMIMPPVLPEIAGNPDQLKQVFLQLLNNAVEALTSADATERAKAAAAAGTQLPEQKILIDASFDDSKLHILFSDTGPGFRDPHRVFDPFFTTKQPGEGTGLGLSICYGIVREHQGEINAFNLHPFGAAVVVDLPLRNSSLQTDFSGSLGDRRPDHQTQEHRSQDHYGEYPVPELP
jgi:two-component system NtrC family sensor kinase